MILKRLMMIVLIISLFGCTGEEKTPQINKYYAIVSEFKYRIFDMDLIYKDDEDYYKTMIFEINYLLEKSNEINLENEYDLKIRDSINDNAKSFIEVIKKFRQVSLENVNKEKKENYSLTNKYNELLEEYTKYRDILDDSIYEIDFKIVHSQRTKVLDNFKNNMSDVEKDIYNAYDLRDEISRLGNLASNEDYKKLDNAINTAQESVASLKQVSVNLEDEDVKEKTIALYEKILNVIKEAKKINKDSNIYEHNNYIRKLNKLIRDMYINDIYYNVDVLPNIPSDIKAKIKMSSQ